jgi:hypothetical protein
VELPLKRLDESQSTENRFLFLFSAALVAAGVCSATAGAAAIADGAVAGVESDGPDGVRTGVGREEKAEVRMLPVRAGNGGGEEAEGAVAIVDADGSDFRGEAAGLGSFSTESTLSKPSMPMILSSILLT